MTRTATKSHNGNPRSSTFILLVLPAHRRNYRTNTGGDADDEYEEDPCEGPDYDADEFPAEQRQRQVSLRREPHRTFTSFLRQITGHNLEDKRPCNDPITIESNCSTEDVLAARERAGGPKPPGTIARYSVPVEGPGQMNRTGPVRGGRYRRPDPMGNVAGPRGSSPGLALLYDTRSRRRIPQMSDFSAIRKDRGAHGSTLSLIQVPPKRPGVGRRQLPRPGPVLGAHTKSGAAADLMEVVVQAARLLSDHELLANGLEVLSGQPPPTVSHASSSKGRDRSKRNPTPPQRQLLAPGIISIPRYCPEWPVFGVVRDGPLVQNTLVRRRRHRCRGARPGDLHPAGRRSRGEQRVRARIDLVKGAATSITLLILLTLAPVSSPDRAVAQETKAPRGAPKLDAGSRTLIDADTGLYLAGKDPDKRVAIASTHKIMVALVALDEGVDLDEQVTVSAD